MFQKKKTKKKEYASNQRHLKILSFNQKAKAFSFRKKNEKDKGS